MHLTCTVSQMTRCRFDKSVDIIVTAAGFDLDGVGFESAALVLPVSTYFSSNNAVAYLWVRLGQPERCVGAAMVRFDALLRHLDAPAPVVEAIPSLPLNLTITLDTLGGVVGGPPGLVQYFVTVARVNVGTAVTFAVIFILPVQPKVCRN